jgi:NADH-quinone oxidoreductase subunit M
MAVLLDHVLSLLLLVLVSGALASVLAAARNRPAHARWAALVSSVASCLGAVALWIRYDPDGKTWQFAERYDWGASIGAALYLGVDGASILLLLLTSLVTVVAVAASWNQTQPKRNLYGLLLVGEAAIFGVYMALDLLTFFLCWQIALLALYGLIREPPSSPEFSRRFLYVTLCLAVLMLGGMAALYFGSANGTRPSSSDITLLHTGALPAAVQTPVFIAFAVAFAAPMWIVPLRRWIVDARSGRSTAGELLVAALLTKLGAYGFFRLVLPVLPDASRRFASVVVWIALAAIAGAAIAAWRQQDVPRRIAFATASHAGVMMAALFALTPAGLAAGLVQQFGQGLWVAVIFVCLAIVYRGTDARDVRGLNGLRRRDAVLALFFCAIVVAGIRFSTTLGIVDDAWGIRGSAALPRGWPVGAAASLFLACAYMLPLLRHAIAGQSSDVNGSRRTLSAREAMLLASLAALAVGVAAHPKPLLDSIEPSVSRVVVRLHPELAPYLRLGADCPTAAPPDPAGPPPGFMLVQPCAEGELPSPKL